MRKLKRAVAKANMKRKGLSRIFKKTGGENYFSKHWREYV